MNRIKQIQICLFVSVMVLPLTTVPAQTGNQDKTSHRNPFTRSVVAAQEQNKLESQAESKGSSPVEISIRGIILAGSNSMVSVGGKILSIGETVSGHTLVSVREREADFRRNGVITTLVLDDGRSREETQ